MIENNLCVIKAGRDPGRYWRDLWRYRDLFLILAWRDVLVRYKQTVIGLAWCLLRPFLMMVAFTVIFDRLAKLPSQGVPYPILVFAALLPWQFFSTSLSDISLSLTVNANLISKVYFPRIAIPLSALGVNLLDFCISLVILIGLMLFYHFLPGWQILCLPVFLFSALLASLGLGLCFSALNVQYRDFRYVVPFVVQFGLYLSPVGFSSAIVPDTWRLLYSLNPMVGVIEGFRWAILGEPLYWPSQLLSWSVSAVLMLSGLYYFRRVERKMADVI